MDDAAIPGPAPTGLADQQARELADLRAEVARLRARLGLREAPRLPGLKLRDLAVVIGATAVGLAIVRANRAGFTNHLPGSKVNGTIWGSTFVTACNAYMWAGLVAVMWTLTALHFRLRRPRPRIRMLARRPGFAMCCAAALTYLAAWGALAIATARTPPASQPDLGDWIFFPSLPTGSAVGSAWFLAALGGRCRPGPDRLDRAAWLLGLYWLGMVPASLLAIFAS